MLFKCKRTNETLTARQVRMTRCNVKREDGRSMTVFPARDPANWSDKILDRLNIERIQE